MKISEVWRVPSSNRDLQLGVSPLFCDKIAGSTFGTFETVRRCAEDFSAEISEVKESTAGARQKMRKGEMFVKTCENKERLPVGMIIYIA